ncbi:gluconate 2-dehydrogenase subunit 3 family protein [Haloarcula marina]|uniref:gluconate 2-dehydrogenase subunit 3 family protein n=1 Tax=Haloarcula marina TaxID=2961574 RepID=UPI0020B7DD24|nr:gluconate 2-dehydrogenase subunit 3 family protein [Halomicroarcula marina]
MTDYELTRRDALKALGAAGVTVAGGVAALSWPDGESEDENVAMGEHERETVRAVASTVYPSELRGVAGFVDGYLAGRVDADPERARGIADAVAALDRYAHDWEGDDFAALDAPKRDETLRGMGVHVSTPDPDGDPRQRVRYYLVNDLQFALYSSPTGGTLVGIENPQGHPGGTKSYRRPPE